MYEIQIKMNSQNNSNFHPEMNDDNMSFGNNVPKTIQELLLMQKANQNNSFSSGLRSIKDMPHMRNFLESSKEYICKSINKGISKIHENMELLDNLKIIESKRFNKMKHLNGNLINEEIEELTKDRYYLEKFVDLMKNIDHDLQSFIYKFSELEKITKNISTGLEDQ